MFTYSHALVDCLSLLGLQGSLPHQGSCKEIKLNESLFLDPEFARIHFMTITFYLFCCLDFERAFTLLKPYWPTERPLEEKMYIQRAMGWLEELDQPGCLLSYVPLRQVFFTECAGPVMQKIMFVFTLTVMQKLIDNNFKTDLPAIHYVDQTRLRTQTEGFVREFLEIEDRALDYDNQDQRYLYFEKSIIQHLKTYSLRESFTRAVKAYLEQGCHYYRKPHIIKPNLPPSIRLLQRQPSRQTDTQQTPPHVDIQLEQQAQSHAKRLQYRTIYNTAYFDSDTIVVSDDTQSTANSISFKQKVQQAKYTLSRKPSDSGFHFTKPKEETAYALTRDSDDEEEENRVEMGRTEQVKKTTLSPPEKRDIRTALINLRKGKGIQSGFRNPHGP